MGLARKGSRAIRVDGRDYRWTVSPDSGCMWIIVESSAGTGQRLEARIAYRDTSEEPGGPPKQRARVTPEVVRLAIRHGIAEGWHPTEDGPPFRLEDAEAKIWGA